MKKVCLAIFSAIALLSARVALAQYTTVTATAGIKDSNNVAYTGTYTVTFIPSSGDAANARLNGNTFTQILTGTLTSGGAFPSPLSIADDHAISPHESRWQFFTCAGNGFPCFTTTLDIHGSSQDVASSLSALAPNVNSGYIPSTIVQNTAAVLNLHGPANPGVYVVDAPGQYYPSAAFTDTTGKGVAITSKGIVFPDASLQTTAGGGGGGLPSGQPGNLISYSSPGSTGVVLGNMNFTTTTPYIDPTASGYGAKCDGSTDDTAAFQTAFNVFNAAGYGHLHLSSTGNTCRIKGYSTAITNVAIDSPTNYVVLTVSSPPPSWLIAGDMGTVSGMTGITGTIPNNATPVLVNATTSTTITLSVATGTWSGTATTGTFTAGLSTNANVVVDTDCGVRLSATNCGAIKNSSTDNAIWLLASVPCTAGAVSPGTCPNSGTAPNTLSVEGLTFEGTTNTDTVALGGLLLWSDNGYEVQKNQFQGFTGGYGYLFYDGTDSGVAASNAQNGIAFNNKEFDVKYGTGSWGKLSSPVFLGNHIECSSTTVPAGSIAYDLGFNWDFNILSGTASTGGQTILLGNAQEDCQMGIASMGKANEKYFGKAMEILGSAGSTNNVIGVSLKSDTGVTLNTYAVSTCTPVHVDTLSSSVSLVKLGGSTNVGAYCTGNQTADGGSFTAQSNVVDSGAQSTTECDEITSTQTSGSFCTGDRVQFFSFDHGVAAPSGTAVPLTLTGDANNSDLLDINLNGGSGGNGLKLDYLGNLTIAGSLTWGGNSILLPQSSTAGFVSIPAANTGTAEGYTSYAEGTSAGIYTRMFGSQTVAGLPCALSTVPSADCGPGSALAFNPLTGADQLIGSGSGTQYGSLGVYTPVALSLTSCSTTSSAVTYNVSTHAFGCNPTLSVPLSGLTGAASTTTNTEVAAGDITTFAGVETAALTYPFNFTDANSTGNTSSGAVTIATTGSSTAAVPLILLEGTAAGNFLTACGGTSSITNGVVTCGTPEFGISASGKISKYNSISPVSNGVPLETATIDLTAQTAAISTGTSLYTPTATGMYRIVYYAKVTTAATTSSILGGTTGLSLAYTDGTDSVVQTAFTLPETSQTGNSVAIGTGNTTNTTQATLTGSAVIFAKTGVAITYGFGYTSVGGTPMAYELHMKVEAM